MKAEHTPGPWSLSANVVNHGSSRIRDMRQDVVGPPDDTKARMSVVVATIVNRDAPYGEANAILIAAAPQLLLACEEVLRWAAAPGNHGGINPYMLAFVKEAQAAVAAAKGEK